MKIYSKDSIWQSPSGKWAYKNLAGVINRFDTEQEAARFKKTWKPHLSNLIKEGVIKKGDVISLKLYGTPEPFDLELEGVKGRSTLFSAQGKTWSLTQIKQIVSKKLDKPAHSIGLNYNQTMHVPSGKSIIQLKKDFVSSRREEKKLQEEELQPFDFSSSLDLNTNEESNLQEEKTESSLINFRSDFKKYEEAQLDVLLQLKTIPQEKVLECYKGSLKLFLSNDGAAS